MSSGKANSALRNNAAGIIFQSSVYGSTIPAIFGLARSNIFMIWAEHLRQGNGGLKKLPKAQKGQPNYVENADFLIGHNPISGVLQCWLNGSRLPLNYTSQSFAGPLGAITITDPNFYWVIGVTVTYPYSVTFNDYGGGTQTLTGTYEQPCWNTWYQGPDPTNPTGQQFFPNVYRWIPGSGPTIEINNQWMFGGYTVKVYYAQLQPNAIGLYTKKQMDTDIPIAALQCDFESVLGDGPEYTTPIDFTGQRILYPHYAGMGTPILDLGSGPAVPQILPEVLGAWPVYPSGDCDLTDIIEDIFKQGVSQAGIAAGIGAYSPVQRGLNCYDLPGAIQKVDGTSVEAFLAPGPYPYALPVTKGNFLVAAASTGGIGGTSYTIADTLANSWTALFGSVGCQLWWTQVAASGADALTFGGLGAGWVESFFEISGVDTFDSSAVGTSPTISITTTNTKGNPAYILAFAEYSGSSAPATNSLPLWKTETLNGTIVVYSRVVYSPGTYSITFPATFLANVGIIAFKASQPANYPMPLGNILDAKSLALTKLQCRANGLIGSLVMDQQKAAKDWLEDLATAADCAYVWSGFKLKVLPLSEVSAVGNGAIYVAPTASGPVANLSTENEDFIGSVSTSPLKFSRKGQVNVPNLLQIQHPNRGNEYNDVVISQPETGALALYGPRKESPKQLRCVYDPVVGRMILGIQIRVQNYLRNTYTFTAHAKWKLLEPLDLITITDPLMGINQLPVRLNTIVENEDRTLDCTAEPFIYGCYAPIPAPAVTSNQPYVPTTGAPPGNVNPPLMFQPPQRLSNLGTPQLWVALSGLNPNWGGAAVYGSLDGLSYVFLGQQIGQSIMGLTTNLLPVGLDPDAVNTLDLDLTESSSTLSSVTAANENLLTSLSVLTGGGSTCEPFELMAYGAVTLLSAGHYALNAGGGNFLRRGIYGTAISAHPIGSQWALLSGPLAKLNINPAWLGQTIYLKFLSFNTMSGGMQGLGDVTPYTFTLEACALGYTISPNPVLSQSSAGVWYVNNSAGNTWAVTITDAGSFVETPVAAQTPPPIKLNVAASTANTYQLQIDLSLPGGIDILRIPYDASQPTSLVLASPTYAWTITMVLSGGNPSLVQTRGGAASANQIVVAPFTATFDWGAITFLGASIPVASSTGTYYVYVYDPTYASEAPGSPFLYLANTTNADSSLPGYIYLGSITLSTSGSAPSTLGGSAFALVASTPPVFTAGPILNFASPPASTPVDSGDHQHFTLPQAPNPAGSLLLTLNGLAQNPGAGNDFVLSGTAITMHAPITGTFTLLAWYQF